MRLAIALLFAVSTTSCIGDEDGDGSNYVVITEIDKAYQEAYCKYAAACGLFESEEVCRGANLTSSSFELDPNVVAAVGAGRVYYNGSNVKECFDAVAARTCDETSESARTTPAACRNVIVGTVHGGEACTIDEECISQQCSGGGGNDSCIMGTCIGDVAQTFEPAQIGEQCGSTAGCVPGAYCDNQTITCQLLKTQGASCQQASECEYGLGCTGTVGARTCGPLPGVGESCATDFICRDEGTYCDSTTTMCVQVGLPGTMCNSSQDCSQYYPCDFVSTLQCKKGPGVGEPCSSSNRCFDLGTFCDFNTSTCVERKSNGMTCVNDAECASNFCDQNQATPACANPMVCF
jgi:hypothetical protein